VTSHFLSFGVGAYIGICTIQSSRCPVGPIAPIGQRLISHFHLSRFRLQECREAAPSRITSSDAKARERYIQKQMSHYFSASKT